MDFSQIQELIRLVSKHKLTEFKLEDGEFKLIIKNQSHIEQVVSSGTPQMVFPTASPVVTVAPPTQSPAAPAPRAEAPRAESEKPEAAPPADKGSENYLEIKSPMVGTFYRSAAPDKPPFIKVGDSVDAGTTVCIIEAMKLFNEIESDIKGKIVKVLVEDASPVEYDQPLFLVDPS